MDSLLVHLTRMEGRVGALVITNQGMQRALEDLKSADWFDPSLDRSQNKDRMKCTGAAIGQYREKLGEMMVVAMWQIVESCLSDFRKELSLQLDDSAIPPEIRELKLFANVIKHDAGRVDAHHGGSSSRQLVDKFGVKNGFVPGDALCASAEILERLYSVERFLKDALCKALGGSELACRVLRKGEAADVQAHMARYLQGIPSWAARQSE